MSLSKNQLNMVLQSIKKLLSFKVDKSDTELLLPIVSDDDNGKILKVVNGKWEAVTINFAEESDF